MPIKQKRKEFGGEKPSMIIEGRGIGGEEGKESQHRKNQLSASFGADIHMPPMRRSLTKYQWQHTPGKRGLVLYMNKRLSHECSRQKASDCSGRKNYRTWGGNTMLDKGDKKKMIILQPALPTTPPASPSLLILSVFPYQRVLQVPFFGAVGEGRTRQMLHAQGVGFLLTVQ